MTSKSLCLTFGGHVSARGWARPPRRTALLPMLRDAGDCTRDCRWLFRQNGGGRCALQGSVARVVRRQVPKSACGGLYPLDRRPYINDCPPPLWRNISTLQFLFVKNRNLVTFAANRQRSPSMKKTVREVIELLEANGWTYIGTRGDHHKFFKKGARRPIIIAGKRNSDLAEGALQSILREAKLK